MRAGALGLLKVWSPSRGSARTHPVRTGLEDSRVGLTLNQPAPSRHRPKKRLTPRTLTPGLVQLFQRVAIY